MTSGNVVREPARRVRSPGVGRKKKPGRKESDPTNLGFRAPPELITAIDAEAQYMGAEKRGLKVSRSQAVIVLLWEALDARAKVRSGK